MAGVVLLEHRLPQRPPRGLVEKADPVRNGIARRVVLENVPAGASVSGVDRLAQGIDRRGTDIDAIEPLVPMRERLIADHAAQKLEHRLLMRPGASLA